MNKYWFYHGGGYFTLAFLGMIVLTTCISAIFQIKNNDYIEREQYKPANKLSPKIDTKSQQAHYKDVNYQQAENANWWPKNESPVLKEMVKSGELPTLLERIGPEPIVYQTENNIGKYGGTWRRLSTGVTETFLVADSFMSYVGLVRWSKNGFPIVPHLAKEVHSSDDHSVFKFTLRKNVKWSDGHPFTTEDIRYWWDDENLALKLPFEEYFYAKGKLGKLTVTDKYNFSITFDDPNPQFLTQLAGPGGKKILSSPSHYLKPFHPIYGDKKKIQSEIKKYNIRNKDIMYLSKKNKKNPELPSMRPWVYQNFKASSPISFVRNPYYPMVDQKGNQLPYIDRVLYHEKNQKVMNTAFINGEASVQALHVNFENYSALLKNQSKSNYKLYHWYSADRSKFAVVFNINRRAVDSESGSNEKAQLLKNVNFRKAMSIGVDRQSIIDSFFYGVGEVANNMPSKESPYYDEYAYKAFTQFSPNTANTLLDSLGLSIRDEDGYRTLPSGKRLTIYLYATQLTDLGPSEILISMWANLGLRVQLKVQNMQLYRIQSQALLHDMTIWHGNNEYLPIIQPRYAVPVRGSLFAIAYQKWYLNGGHLNSNVELSYPIPRDDILLENVKLYEQAKDLPFSNKQIDLIGQILRNAANQVYTINIASPPPTVFVVDENIRNIPEVAVSTWTFQSPGNAGMETYYFDNAIFDEDVAELIQNELSNFTGQPAHNSESISTEVDNGWSFSSLISWLTILIIFIILGIASLKHAFVLKRIMLCIPTLLVISILIFTIIKLPPGDFLSSKIIQLELLGDTASITELNYLKEQYNLNKSSVYQYLHWMGFHWFVTFSAEDKGIMQGFLGYSMEFSSSVNAILSDDILFFTVALSLLSMFVTWGVALPLGIYSAVRQYSNSDWVISFITFISMSIPSFILSIFVLFIANILFDIQISGLLSPEYEDQPGWNWHKFIDLLKNLAIPTFILALSSIGNMIRIMRGSLLDELKQPYVKSAIARGVHPVKGLFKYPVRVALNPFVSSIGGLLPQIISGGTIIAVILSLPTVGPLLLNSLQNEDMYLAGSLLLLLSFFSVIGTLISDILLVYLDPRIRYESKNGG